MSVLSDREIMARVGMIEPIEFAPAREPGRISWGMSSYGYDARLARQFKVFQPPYSYAGLIDPKNFDPACMVDYEGDHVVIPANSFALGVSLERFRIPRDVLAVCVGKSTYARCGLIVNVTPLEPEWEGHVTIELSNTAPLPCKVYAGEGIMQVVFFRADQTCQTSYADKAGRYQGQVGVTLPFVRG